jgi:hypothetical protein
MVKKFWSIALLLSVVLVIGLTGCGEKPKKTDTKSSSAKLVATPKNDESTQIVPASVVEEKVEVRVSELSSKEFGRENPFQPLGLFAEKSNIVSSRTKIIQANEDRLAAKSISRSPEPPQKAKVLPNVKLTLIIDGNTAIFEDNHNSKVASIGDSVAGMKIVEIRKSEAIIDGGDKKYMVLLGGGVEELSSPAPKTNLGTRKPGTK